MFVCSPMDVTENCHKAEFVIHCKNKALEIEKKIKNNLFFFAKKPLSKLITP